MINNTDLPDSELKYCIETVLSNIPEFAWEDCDLEGIPCFVNTPIGDYTIQEGICSETDMKCELYFNFKKLYKSTNNIDKLKELAFRHYKSKIAVSLGTFG